MKTETAVVKSKVGAAVKRELGSVQYEVFETVDEAVNHLGAEKALELINTQHKTLLMNQFRAQATGTPNNKALKEEAYNQLYNEGALHNLIGNFKGLQDAIDKRAEELKKKYQAGVAAAPVGAEEEDDDDE